MGRVAEVDVAHIDLAYRPDRFLKISPSGQVPVLRIARERADDVIRFEGVVILEYLDKVDLTWGQDPLILRVLRHSTFARKPTGAQPWLAGRAMTPTGSERR